MAEFCWKDAGFVKQCIGEVYRHEQWKLVLSCTNFPKKCQSAKEVVLKALQ